MAEGKGFVFEKEKYIDRLKGTARLYRHSVHHTRYLHIDAPDDNNFFFIAFRTFPGDDSGICHALEHMVLHGSKKYPVTDVFFELEKRSVNTFLNAMTFQDMTAYPFSTMNEKDFHNILDIYLDAVFYPNLKKEHFEAEVHHIEFASKDDPESPLIHNGVVYNEMKGVYQDFDDVFTELTTRQAVPDTVYNASEGGYPDDIAKLTVERLREFHKQRYTPSNAFVCHYGSFDDERIRKQVEAYFDVPYIEPYTTPLQHLYQEPFGHPRRLEVETEVDECNESDKQNKVCVVWNCGRSTDLQKARELDLLSDLLTGSNSSPLYTKLIDSGLASKWCGNGIPPAFPLIFKIGVADVDDADVVIQTIYDTMKETIKDGFNPADIEGLIAREELSNHEKSAKQGYQECLKIITTYTEDDDPIPKLDTTTILENVKEKLKANPRYFETLLQELLDNQERLELISRPNPEIEKDFNEDLVEYKETLTPEQKQEIIKHTHEIEDVINAPRPVEVLPCIHLVDMNRTEEHIDYTIDDNIWIFRQPLDSLVYMTVAFYPPVNSYLPMLDTLGEVLVQVGGATMDKAEFARQENLFTGGITARAVISNERPALVFEGFCLERNIDKMLQLYREFLTSPRLEDATPIIAQTESESRSSLPGRSGILMTAQASMRSFGRGAALKAIVSGPTQIRVLKDMVKNPEQTISQLKELFATLRKSHAEISVTCGDSFNNFEGIRLLEKDLNKTFEAIEDDWTVVDNVVSDKESVFYETGASSNNTAIGFAIKDFAPYFAAANLIDNDYIIQAIRLGIGAYGAHTRIDRKLGTGCMVTYRESSPVEVVEAFRNILHTAYAADIPAANVESAIVKAISELDTPVAPQYKGNPYFLSRNTNEELQKVRDDLFQITIDQIKAAIKDIEEQQWRVAIIGSSKSSTLPDGYRDEQI